MRGAQALHYGYIQEVLVHTSLLIAAPELSRNSDKPCLLDTFHRPRFDMFCTGTLWDFDTVLHALVEFYINATGE